MRKGDVRRTGILVLIAWIVLIARFVELGAGRAGRQLSVLTMHSDGDDESVLHEIELR